MTVLHDHDRADLEDGVRTMLHRLAAGATERPPAWADLVARHEALVVPLGHQAAAAGTRGRRAVPGRRARLSLAAAAVLVLAAAGALVVDRTGSGTADSPAAETIAAVSPSDPSFDARAAAAVWATGVDEPVAATVAYLAAMGVPLDGAAAPTAVLRGTSGSTAVVDWALPGGRGATGTVHLRSTAVAGSPPTWTVVGAAAPDVALADVRYDGDELLFTVARTAAGTGQVAVSAWIDGQPVSLGGDAVARAGAGDVPLGELVDLGTAAGARDTRRLPAGADDIVGLRVVHVVDGMVRSLTQMAVALPGADPAAAAAGVPPAVAGGGQVNGQAGAGAGGTGRSGGAEAGGTGAVEVVPGVTVPPLPLPPLPTLPPTPTPTLPPTPGLTVPTPPTSILGAGPGLLP
jgi:hypothetical protein